MKRQTIIGTRGLVIVILIWDRRRNRCRHLRLWRVGIVPIVGSITSWL